MIRALRKVSIGPNRSETLSLKEFMKDDKEQLKNNKSSITKIGESKKGKLNLAPSFLNRIETIDFKTFCEGGSPEYIAAKQALKDSHLRHRNGFPICGEPTEYRFTQTKSRSLTAYSLYFNPAAFFDPTFILIGAGIVLVAIIEKKFADNGLISIAAILSTVLRLALPVVALGSIIYVINHASFLL